MVITGQGIFKDRKINPEKYFIVWIKIHKSIQRLPVHFFFQQKFLGLREKEASP